jgi:transposase
MPIDYEGQIKLLNSIIEQQAKRISDQDATIKELRSLINELRCLKANLEETLGEFGRQLFGAKSEKTSTKAPGHPDSGDKNGGPSNEATTVKGHTRLRGKKTTREDLYAGLPITDVVCPVTGEGRFCGYCNSGMQFLSYKEVRTELRITPAKVERVRYLQEVLICPECRKDGDGTIVQAKTPTPLLPHSPASPSIVAYVMFQKVFMSLPYYRQEATMLQLGLKLPRETMANWFIRGAFDYFKPLYSRLHELLIQRDLIHLDETTCQVLHEKGKAAESTSYMWIYLTGSDGKPPIVLYDYQPGRNGGYAKGFLEGIPAWSNAMLTAVIIR